MSHYYGVEGPAYRIWALLASETSLGSICGTLAAEYEVESQRCRMETAAFPSMLISEGLVRAIYAQERKNSQLVSCFG